MDHGDFPLKKMLVIVFVSCLLAYLTIMPIMLYHESSHAYMRLLWLDGNIVIKNVKCWTVGRSC